MIVQLKNQNAEGSIDVEIKHGPHGIEINPEGYGDFESAEGQGSPIFLEYYEGHLRLLVWADINDPEPSHIIDLQGALESTRKEE